MSEHEKHCPFLNRADARCARHFSLDRLGHALEYCFDKYHDCSVYFVLLAERQERRAHCGDQVVADRPTASPIHAPAQFVQVQVAARYAKHPSRGAGISPSPRV
jgi:hypothetical protein